MLDLLMWPFSLHYSSATKQSYLKNTSSTTMISKDTKDHSDETVIIIKDPTDLQDLEEAYRKLYSNKQQRNNGNLHLRLAQRLFGPPRISLSWKQRCHLVGFLGQMENLTSLTFQGTTMGQVISAELLAKAIPPQLQELTVHAGLILDEVSSVTVLAEAIQGHTYLKSVRLYHFLNHVRPIQELQKVRLLDRLIHALATTCPQLQTLELSCLASIVEWHVPLVSTEALTRLFDRPTPYRPLQCLGLTNLGLGDAELGIIANHLSSPAASSSLSTLVLNGNENTLVGLRSILFHGLSIGSNLRQLQVMNHIKLTDELYDYVIWYLERYMPSGTCPLQQLRVTLPLRIDPTLLQLYLAWQQLYLPRRYFDPTMATITNQVQVLAHASKRKDPTLLYRLLQEQPTLLLCHSTTDTTSPRNPTLTAKQIIDTAILNGETSSDPISSATLLASDMSYCHPRRIYYCGKMRVYLWNTLVITKTTAMSIKPWYLALLMIVMLLLVSPKASIGSYTADRIVYSVPPPPPTTATKESEWNNFSATLEEQKHNQCPIAHDSSTVLSTSPIVFEMTSSKIGNTIPLTKTMGQSLLQY